MTTTSPTANPAAQSKLIEATNSIAKVSNAIQNAKSATSAGSGSSCAIESELNKGLTELLKVSAAVTAASNLVSPPPLSQFQIVKQHMIEKALDGALLSLPMILVAFLDKSGKFLNYIYDNLTIMPKEVILVGLMSAYLYYLLPNKRTFYARAASTWVDLVQQFFCLGVGAFWVMQFARLMKSSESSPAFPFDLKAQFISFGTMLVGAFVASAMYCLRDTPIDNKIKKVCHAATISSVVLLLILLRNGD